MSEEDEANLAGVKPTLMPDELHLNLVEEKMLSNSFRKRKEGLKRYLDTEHGSVSTATLDEEEALTFNQEDLLLWIDPLDGTKSFSQG